MELFYLSRIYVTAVEFSEMGCGDMIDSQTLNSLISELERLNQKTDKLSQDDITVIEYIFLILDLYGKKECIKHTKLSDAIIHMREKISV